MRMVLAGHMRMVLYTVIDTLLPNRLSTFGLNYTFGLNEVRCAVGHGCGKHISSG